MNTLLLFFFALGLSTTIFGGPVSHKNEANPVVIEDPFKSEMYKMVKNLGRVVSILSQREKVDVENAIKTIDDVVKTHLNVMMNISKSYKEFVPSPECVPSYVDSANVDYLLPRKETPILQGSENGQNFMPQGVKLEEVVNNFLDNVGNNTNYSISNNQTATSNTTVIKIQDI